MKGRLYEALEPKLAAELAEFYQKDMENFTSLTGMMIPLNSQQT